MTIEEALNQIQRMNYTNIERPDNYETDAWCFEWEKKEPDGSHHVVTIEDHRWEREGPYFDPFKNPSDVGEWLIFSECDNEERDYFGHFAHTQYPLTLPEIKAFLDLIEACEKEEKR